jgi:DNA-binding NarL/FixJ family response regulator
MSTAGTGPSSAVSGKVPRTAKNERGSTAVWLVAGDGPRQTIARIMAREGFPLRPFDSVEAILGQDAQEHPSAVVIWAEDTVASLPGLVQPLTKRFGPAPVVVVCATIERWGVRAALTAGAAGVVLAAELDQALAPCLRAAQAGQICVPREHWRQIEPPVLSTREKQILGLVVMGYMNSQIASQLFLAESTVKSHLSSAFGKLGVRSRNEAVNLILDPERGLGMGILGLVGKPVQPTPARLDEMRQS